MEIIKESEKILALTMRNGERERLSTFSIFHVLVGFVKTSYKMRTLIKISSVIFQMFIETQNIAQRQSIYVEGSFEDFNRRIFFCTSKITIDFRGLRI